MLKKALALVLVIALTATIAITGTVAYLQSEDSDVNVMTLGNVSIEQIEQERDETGALVDFTQAKPAYPAVGEIDWADTGVNVNGTEYKVFDADLKNVVDKIVTVKNTGKSDAYVRTIVAIEAPDYDPDDLIRINYNGTDVAISGPITVEIDDVEYVTFVFTYAEALKPGAISAPSLMQVFLDSATTNEDVAKFGDTWEILVLSQAVQTEGFADAATALNTAFPFGEDNANLIAWFGGMEIPDLETLLVDKWDGTVDTSWYDPNDTTKTEYTLTTAEELVGFAELANEGNTFSKKTIVLDSNMDLDGKVWTPIKKFAGTLVGNDHTIGNFEIDATANYGGFIDVLEWGTVEDLVLADITATVGDYRFGTLARSINQSNIDNVTVKNVNVTTTASTAFVAGLFGHGTVNSNMEVNNCTVENLTVNAEAGAYLIGGITTFVQKNGTEAEGTNIFENLNVKNFKVIVNDTDGVCGVGGLVGQTQSVWQNPRFNNCSVSGLDVTATGMVDVGGFMCYPGSWTYAENCTAEGKIDVSGVTSADNFAGGFFGNYGWGDNVGKGDHKVTSCSADVDITTKFASAGGFVGSGTNSEGRNKNITLTNCEAKGTVTVAAGGTANIGGFAGQTDRGIYINCTAAQEPFIGKVLDGYTLNDDGNGTLTVTK